MTQNETTTEAAFAAHHSPFEIFLLSILLEEHKEVLRMKELIKQIKAYLPLN